MLPLWIRYLICLAFAACFIAMVRFVAGWFNRGIFYFQEHGWWPVRVILFPVKLILLCVGFACMASLAKDARNWWRKG